MNHTNGSQSHSSPRHRVRGYRGKNNGKSSVETSSISNLFAAIYNGFMDYTSSSDNSSNNSRLNISTEFKNSSVLDISNIQPDSEIYSNQHKLPNVTAHFQDNDSNRTLNDTAHRQNRAGLTHNPFTTTKPRNNPFVPFGLWNSTATGAHWILCMQNPSPPLQNENNDGSQNTSLGDSFFGDSKKSSVPYIGNGSYKLLLPFAEQEVYNMLVLFLFVFSLLTACCMLVFFTLRQCRKRDQFGRTRRDHPTQQVWQHPQWGTQQTTYELITEGSVLDSPPPYEGPPDYNSLPPDVRKSGRSLEDLCKKVQGVQELFQQVQQRDGDCKQALHVKDGSEQDRNDRNFELQTYNVIQSAVPCQPTQTAEGLHPGTRDLEDLPQETINIDKDWHESQSYEDHWQPTLKGEDQRQMLGAVEYESEESKLREEVTEIDCENVCVQGWPTATSKLLTASSELV